MLTLDRMNTATVQNITKNFNEFDIAVDLTGPVAIVQVQNILAESWDGAASYNVDEFLAIDQVVEQGGLVLNHGTGEHLDTYAFTAAQDHVRRVVKG